MKAEERLFTYASIYTGSDAHATGTPSTPVQWTLAKKLAEEMKGLGMEGVHVDEHAYVYGYISATEGMEDRDAIGFISHMDIVVIPGDGEVHPKLIPNYDGQDIELGTSGRILSPKEFPDLNRAIGQSIMVTDGTSVLGGDDKAGIAAILTMCEQVLQEGKSHGKISVCFTPDEEIGHGASYLDIPGFGVDYAFTVDGLEPDNIEYETFNAATAEVQVHGVAVHPGSAKGLMVNAVLVAMEFNAFLPADETPAKTEGHEGFFHLCEMQGSTEEAYLHYILRDHDAGKLEERKQQMLQAASRLNEIYGEDTVIVNLRDQYRNMAEILKDYPQILEKARKAVRKAGLTPRSLPVRGGTDGSRLSFRGLPCPNLGTGAYGMHGPYEHVLVEELHQVVTILKNIVYDV